MFGFLDDIATNAMLLRIGILILGIGQFISMTSEWGFSMLAPHTIALVLFIVAAITAANNQTVTLVILLVIVAIIVLLLLIFTSDYLIDAMGIVGSCLFLIFLVLRRKKLLAAK